MLSTMQSPNVAHDDHLRNLLDQRAARADLHNRFPSYSEFSDSPSVYSHGVFSPRSRNGVEPPKSIPHTPNTIEPRSPISDRERLNDPSTSTIDLEDDPRFSYATQDYSDDDQSSQHTIDDDDETRMSMLGPKMRFHSPAPWEMGGEVLAEEEEPEDTGLARTLSVPKSERSRTGKEGIMRGLGLNSRPSTSGSRPSNESSRSSGKAKQSFDTNNSYISAGGALHSALAQASMSSTSLGLPPSSPVKSIRNKFANLRVRTQTTSRSDKSNAAHLYAPPASPRVTSDSPRSTPSPGPENGRYISQEGSRCSSPGLPSPSFPASQEYVHPFANPDNALYSRNASYNSARSGTHARQTYVSQVVPSGSDMTVTDATTSSSQSQSIITPVNSATSITHKGKGSSSSAESGWIQGKDISSPVLVHGSIRRPSLADSQFEEGRPAVPPLAMRGWNDNLPSPAFTLISLEEAQAQVKSRARSQTTQVTTSHSHTPSIVSRAEPFPIPDAPDYAFSSKHPPGSPTSVYSSRARARSISTGAKAKNALQGIGMDLTRNMSRVSGNTSLQEDPVNPEGPPRTVKHKRSGFMRLFREKEKERSPQSHPIPPVPSLSEAHGLQFSTSSKVSKDLKRVPVPSLSASLMAEADGMSSTFRSNYNVSRDTLGVGSPTDRRKNSPSPRRGAPTLSIIPPTGPAPSTMPFNPASDNDRQRSMTAAPTLSPSGIPSNSFLACPSPRSAPPGTTDFQGLSLRPVSTAFSAHFSDHLVTESPERKSEFDLDLDTPTTLNTSNATPSTAVSSSSSFGFGSTPISSASGEKSLPFSVTSDDQNAVIQALQEQIASARKGWQRHIWELEGQIRDLKAEVEQLRAAGNSKGYCEACGRGRAESIYVSEETGRTGVLNRPRQPTGIGSRFGSGN